MQSSGIVPMEPPPAGSEPRRSCKGGAPASAWARRRDNARRQSGAWHFCRTGWIVSGAHTGLGAAMLTASDGMRRALPDTAPAAMLAFCGVMSLYAGRSLWRAWRGDTGARERWVRRHPTFTAIVVLSAGLGAIALGRHCEGPRLLQVIAAGSLGLAYCFPLFGAPLRRFGRLKPALLALGWCLVTAPVAGDGMSAATVVRLLGLFGLCLLFDLKDVTRDRAAGIFTPAVILGDASLRRLAGVVFVAGVIAALGAGAHGVAAEVACLALAGHAGTRRGSVFRVVAIGDGALIVAGAAGIVFQR